MLTMFSFVPRLCLLVVDIKIECSLGAFCLEMYDGLGR